MHHLHESCASSCASSCEWTVVVSYVLCPTMEPAPPTDRQSQNVTSMPASACPDKMRRPVFDRFDLFTAPARLDTPLRHSTAEVTSSDNALKEGTPSIMQISVVNFSHILLLCLSKPMRSINGRGCRFHP